ncbi:hypothetical protein B0A69_07185 [Chryseobacterium shigense]|uniref:Uncharacterized protein n=1 Tax=Chryseobacterium shigense TaxID=297244 RepID=A0A1N7I5V3_9FLAO|nr:hypothetical protein B0A69_07185 [Chryseobacterium shigense]SIS32422.1 hypothetical protein SAMN05421639_102210 [Chryseobacterium shigense]
MVCYTDYQNKTLIAPAADEDSAKDRGIVSTINRFLSQLYISTALNFRKNSPEKTCMKLHRISKVNLTKAG